MDVFTLVSRFFKSADTHRGLLADRFRERYDSSQGVIFKLPTSEKPECNRANIQASSIRNVWGYIARFVDAPN